MENFVTSKEWRGLHWQFNNWSIGDPITEEKVDSLEQGLAIVMTRQDAILNEIGGILDPSIVDGIQSNESRIDGLIKEVWAGPHGHPQKRVQQGVDEQGNPIYIIQEQMSVEIDSVPYEKLTGEYFSRIDILESKQTTILDELDGALQIIDAANTQFTLINTRIDSTEKELTINGVSQRYDSKTGQWEIVEHSEFDSDYKYSRLDYILKTLGAEERNDNEHFYIKSRLDVLEVALRGRHVGEINGISGNPFLDSRLDALEYEFGFDNASNIGGNGYKTNGVQLNKFIERINAIAIELGGKNFYEQTNNYQGTSRLTDLEKEIGGSRDQGRGYTLSRLDKIEAELTDPNTSYFTNSRLGLLEEHNALQDNQITAICDEIGGTGPTGATYDGYTRIDEALDKIGALLNEFDGTYTQANLTISNSRLDDLIVTLGGSRDISTHTYTLTRLDSIENKNSEQDGRLNVIEAENTNQNKALNALKNEIGGTYVENSGFTNSRLDALEARASTIENVDSAQTTRLDNIDSKNNEQDARLDKIFGEVYNNEDAERPSRLDTIQTTINQLVNEVNGPNSGFENSRIDTLRTDVDNLINEVNGPSSGFENSRIDKLENITGKDDGQGALIPRISTLENCCENVRRVVGNIDDYTDKNTLIDRMHARDNDITNLYYLLTNGYGNIIRMTYRLPFSFNEAELEGHFRDLAIQAIVVDNEKQFFPYDHIDVDCLGTNIWDNQYFINNTNIQFDNELNAYYGSASAFKLAFNSFFAERPVWQFGVKLTFDFNFFDPLQSLKLVFDYGEEQIVDTRAYQLAESRWERITFISKEENGSFYPIYGISTLFYGSPANEEMVYIKNVQIEVDTSIAATSAQNPSTDIWHIPLPEPIYCGYVDFVNREIVSTYGYIDSYNGEEVGDIWQSSTDELTPGAHVIFLLPTPRVYGITLEPATAEQGFNTVVTRKEVIGLKNTIYNYTYIG